jgi:hypothetical protein
MYKDPNWPKNRDSLAVGDLGNTSLTESGQLLAQANPSASSHARDPDLDVLRDDEFERAGRIYMAYIKQKI